MDDELEFMRARSGPERTRCGACMVEDEMTPEHREAFHKSYEIPSINTTGQLAWLEAKGYDLDRKAPAKVLLQHRSHVR